MATIGGPNTEKDGLVFGYDTGYGVADPGALTRFFKGRPTSNIANGVAFVHDTSGGSAGSCVDAPEKGPGWKKVTITARGSNFRIIQFGSYPTLASNVTYASSFEADWGNMRGKGYSLTQDGSGGGNRNYFKNGSYATGVTSTVDIDNTLLDGHVGMNITKTVENNGTHVHVPFIYNGGTNTTGLNDYFYYKEYQQEVGTIPTPYVDNTRSNTQSLIDLKRTTDISVANMSFDSTGQPDYDGTDDYIELGDSLNSTGSNATFEMVFKATETNDTYRIMLGWGNGSSNYSGIHIGNWMSGYTDESFHVTFNSNTLTMLVRKGHTFYKDNKFHHAIVTVGYNNYSIWIDGVEQTFTFSAGSQSTILNNVIGYNSNITSQIGRRPYGGGSGYFKGDLPVMKVYDRILSDEEIKQNYNAYKNRFDI